MIISSLQAAKRTDETMSQNTHPLKIRSANLQAGIEYEVKREIVNMKISEKASEIFKNEVFEKPSDEDIAELQRLAASR
jgi:hypothetical protein